ncbi:hypothetical protein SBDP2_310012 [Syntrophobacter sp. SbD2]|nr:hypothetical protein SBDP2_310012 [Syntrophobacter sp. SbD2]
MEKSRRKDTRFVCKVVRDSDDQIQIEIHIYAMPSVLLLCSCSRPFAGFARSERH